MITCLFADREFVGIKWFGYLIENNIKFVIRIKKNTQVSNSEASPFPQKISFEAYHAAARSFYRVNEQYGDTLFMSLA